MTGTTFWSHLNKTTNESGFSGLPSGIRYKEGFYGLGLVGFWWSSSESDNSFAWSLSIDDGSSSRVNRKYGNKEYGFSVRCLKD